MSGRIEVRLGSCRRQGDEGLIGTSETSQTRSTAVRQMVGQNNTVGPRQSNRGLRRGKQVKSMGFADEEWTRREESGSGIGARLMMYVPPTVWRVQTHLEMRRIQWTNNSSEA
jgi:hypothetical protein